MITAFKKRWEITQNWQFIHPILACLATAFSAYLIARGILNKFIITNTVLKAILLFSIGVLAYLAIIRICLWCFKKLKNRWKVTYRWEYIAIFLVFAITGSTAGRISDPLMNLLGLSKEVTNGWVYWPFRILLIFPIYQVLLVVFGWIFGKYRFFRDFAIKMASRMGFAFLFAKKS